MMKIDDLSLDIWGDIFDFIPRKCLAEKVDRLGSGQFWSIADFWLHQQGKWTLEPITLLRHPPSGGGYLFAGIGYFPEPEPPDVTWPMPKNIVDFQLISIATTTNYYLCGRQLEFFENIRRLFVDVNFILGDINYPQNISMADSFVHIVATFGKVVPLISSVKSIYAYHLELLMEIEQKFAGTFMDARILGFINAGHGPGSGRIQPDYAQILANWLTTKRATDNEPRMLLAPNKMENIEILCEKIKKAFLQAEQPISFFVLFLKNLSTVDAEDRMEFVEKNAKTKERLDGQYLLGRYTLISRHPLNAPIEWVEEKQKEIKEFAWGGQKRQIWLK